MLVIALLLAVYASIAQGAAAVVNMVITMMLVFVPVAGDAVTVSLLAVIVVVLSLFVASWLFGWVSVAIPAYVAEGKMAPVWVGRGSKPLSPIMAVARSFTLVGWRDSLRAGLIWLATFGLILVSMLFSYLGAVAVIFLFVTSLGVEFLGYGVENPLFGLAAWVCLGAATLAILSLSVAYVSAVQTLLYLDLRMRREGLDLALRFTSIPVPDPGGRV